MSQAALAMQHDMLLPRPPGGTGPGALLALAVHAGLIVALTTAIDWRTHTPEIVSAELWASVPQPAAPRPEAPLVAAPPPPPPPAPAPRAEPVRPDAEIAIERAQQRKAEAEKKKAEQRAEAERKRAQAEQAEADRRAVQEREAKAEDERLARQREANLKRLMGQAGGASGSGGTGTAAQSAAPTVAYLGRVAALIRGNSVFPGNVPGSAVAEVEVRTASGGTILSRKLVKSSGHQEWDDAVLRAIDKTATLPRDTDGRVPQMLTIAFRRE
jgi:colicin import membrane protein